MAWRPRARVVDLLQRDRPVDHRADAVADVAAQAEEVQAVLLVDQHRHAHLRLRDVGERAIECAGRAGLDARDVLAHLARHLAGLEVGRADGDLRGQTAQAGAQAQVLRRTVAHAQPAADARAEEVGLGQRAGRTQRLRRPGGRARADQRRSAGQQRGRGRTGRRAGSHSRRLAGHDGQARTIFDRALLVVGLLARSGRWRPASAC